uniref:CDAN1-interacting nuclease 1 n=1 Tax=Phlebotomus papatasi TaxID=29031 RepID=A0A1B0GMH3_PHLPP
MIVLSSELYREVLQRIKNFPGLSIECLHLLHQTYPQFSPRTIWSILSWEHKERLPEDYSKIQQNSPELLQDYERRIEKDPTCEFTVLVMAAERRYSPFILSRILLKEKLKTNEYKANKLLFHPHRIHDEVLRRNVEQCIELDILEGPVPDAYRDKIGVFFENMLYSILSSAGISFDTQVDLQKKGYRKTPDARLLSRCFYRGRRIHWIESKAFFGNTFNHGKVVQRQLTPYSEEFGAGIVIYWMGFVTDILEDVPSKENVFIRCDFPSPQEFSVL